MKDFYATFTADGTANGLANTPADFSVPVPWLRALKGRWECALVEISFDCDFLPKSDRLYLCCDAVEHSFINARQIQLVRNVEIRERYKKYLSETYQNPRYSTFLSGWREYVRLYCLDANLKPVEFDSSKLHCVLHFRIKNEQ